MIFHSDVGMHMAYVVGVYVLSSQVSWGTPDLELD